MRPSVFSQFAIFETQSPRRDRGKEEAISGSLNEMKWVKVPWFLAWGRG